MKKTGRKLLLSSIIALTLTACDRILPVESQNSVATGNSTNETALPSTEPTANPTEDTLQAYGSILMQKKYNNIKDDIMETTHFAISDLDSNGIPELLIGAGPKSIDKFYTYENEAIRDIEIADDADLFPAAGGLYRLPSRNSFAYFRGGPGYTDPEHPENSYMPYTLIEHSIENHQIHMMNYAFWEVCDLGPKAGTTEYTLNEQKCSAEEIIGQYPLTEIKDEYGRSRYHLPAENYIELLPNTDDNRKKMGIDTVSTTD